MSEFTTAADQSFKSTPPGNDPKGNTAVQDLFTDDGVEYGSQAANIDISTGFDAEVKLGARLELYMPLFMDIVCSPLAYLAQAFNKIVFTLGGQYEMLVGNSRTWITGNTNTTIGGNVWEKTGDLKYEEYGTQALLSSASPAGATPFTNIMTVARGAIPTSLESLRKGGGRTAVNFGNKNSYCYGQAISINAVGPLQVVTGFSCKYTLSGKHMDWISANDSYSTKFTGKYWTQKTDAVSCLMTAGNFVLTVGYSQSVDLQTLITTYNTEYGALKDELNASMKAVAPGADINLATKAKAAATAPTMDPITPIPAVMNFQDGFTLDVTGIKNETVTGTYTLGVTTGLTITSPTTSILGTLSLGMPGVVAPDVANVMKAIDPISTFLVAAQAKISAGELETIAEGDVGFGVGPV
jgi:hypothetical protein